MAAPDGADPEIVYPRIRYKRQAIERRVRETLGGVPVDSGDCNALFDYFYAKDGAKGTGKGGAPSPNPGPSLTTIITREAQQQAQKTGMKIQPEGRHDRKHDAIVYTTADTQTLQVNLDGQIIPVNLKAKKWEADFGDGGPKVSTGQQPRPYPEGLKGGLHRKFTRDGTFTVTLTTSWEASFTNPQTGETVTIPEPVITTETSAPQEVRPFTVYLNDQAEERNGH
ncbi:hypothetical protein BSR29_07710 [Boudabousia liubingyangii]|uniref:Uncharacterized protein n=1 Tax=Boudabousia liubingyangii TaxID=1921764 RepID=A0A1Q5PJL9_9ACTO|nr:hypothetical protein [Boudabousia liubingyangii]OKL46133.1 hypothetical protein BSR29_07710 [Boudabousia liubingyangii]